MRFPLWEECPIVHKTVSDTLVHLGYDAGFEDALRTSRKAMMAYFWAFPFLGTYCLASGSTRAGQLLALGLVLAVATLLVIRVAGLLVRIELVMDRERQQLLLRRRILGFTHLVSLAGVEELWGVVTAGEVPAAPVNYWWDYVTLLITRSGRRFRAARHGEDFENADQATRLLGEELGVLVLTGKAGHKAKILPGRDEPRVKLSSFRIKIADGLAVLFWGLMVFVSPFMFLALAFPDT